MRRSTLLLGVAAALVIGGATLYAKGSAVEREREHHIVVVRNQALCEKTLEMAASFTSYAKKQEVTDGLEVTGSMFYTALETKLRSDAYDLGFTEWEYDAVLLKARTDAEAVLIPQINNASDPAAKALELAKSCVPQPLDWYLN